MCVNQWPNDTLLYHVSYMAPPYICGSKMKDKAYFYKTVDIDDDFGGLEKLKCSSEKLTLQGHSHWFLFFLVFYQQLRHKKAQIDFTRDPRTAPVGPRSIPGQYYGAGLVGRTWSALVWSPDRTTCSKNQKFLVHGSLYWKVSFSSF